MSWKTTISKQTPSGLHIRGVRHTTLIKKASFAEAAFLLIAGRKGSRREIRLFETCLVAAIEHGIEVPSAFAARVSASSDNPLHVATAAGILAIGNRHGGAGEKALELLLDPRDAESLVKEECARGTRLAGFGHREYKNEDPRVTVIEKVARKLNYRKGFARARAIESALGKIKGKHFPLNIDGALAACMLELGLSPLLGKPLFALARLPGIIAHAYEEAVLEKTYRRLALEEIEHL